MEEEDKESFLLLLTNLLQIHNPTASTTNAAASLSSSAPLLLFTLSSILSHITTTTKPTKSLPFHYNSTNSSSSSVPPLPSSLSSFRTLSLPSPSRDPLFRTHYSLSYPLFTTISNKLKPYFSQSNLSLPPDYALSIVLSRLALGTSSSSLALRFSLEPYLVSKITNMVTRVISTRLYSEFVQIPVSRSRIAENTDEFLTLTELPNICGAVSGAAVRLRGKVGRSDEGLRHRQSGFPSLLLQVVADHKKIFWDVCVKAPGGSDNATHLRDSLLYHRLTTGDIIWDKVVNVRGQHVRPYIIGGSDYPLLSFLLTPFGRPTTIVEREFDAALMKGRRVVDEAIGLLKGRWKILQDLNVDLNHAPQTIVACCVLHNLCQIAREPEPEVWRENERSADVARGVESEQTSRFYGESLRQALADDLYQRISR